VFIGERPFTVGTGANNLTASKTNCIISKYFKERDTEAPSVLEWKIPTENLVGRYIRVQLAKRNYLHLAEVEVFGIRGSEKHMGKVASVSCGEAVTAAVMRPVSREEARQRCDIKQHA
jgi:hypothetical protein